MPLKTDLNQSPYFDDFDEENNFHQIAFKPSVAVQARELNQLQTILQNQVERFGNNILKTGTIVKGGNFVELSPLPYVKVRDLNINDESPIVSNYDGYKLVGATTGISAYVVEGVVGLEGQIPDLNTLYIEYLDSTDADDKTFSATENILVYDTTDTLVDTVIAAGAVDSDAIGSGYGVQCGDGIVYKDGFFVRFEDQTTIVSSFNTNPDSVVVGFQLVESIVNSDADESLLDNAQGFNNFNAPGADRIKLTAVLTKKTLTEAESDETFFAIQEYRGSNVVRRNLTTFFDSVESFAEQRTLEESGNYTVKDFDLRVENNEDNANTLNLIVGPGIAYVGGKRSEIVNDYRVEFEKITDYATEDNQDIIARYGNYIMVDDMYGHFDFGPMAAISLRDTAHGDSSTPSSAVGSEIGTAYVKNVMNGSNTGEYVVYLDHIKMTSNTSAFTDVKSIWYEGGTYDGAANLILENGNAALKDSSNKILLEPLGRSAIKEFNSTSEFVYRKSLDTTASANGTINITLAGTEEFIYGASATLTDAEKEDILVVMNESVANTYSAGEVIPLSTKTVTTDGTQKVLTIELDEALVSPRDVTIYHDVKIETVKPRGKTLGTYYVKIDANNNVSNTYSLGIPDVLSIEGVYTDANTYTESGTDITANFRLVTNQRDSHYGLSYITAKNATGITDGDSVLVKFKAFKELTTGSYADTYFTVDSYPVDDASATLPADKIRTEQIPQYTVGSAKIKLRDVIDYRPYAANTAAYATTIGGATVDPSSTLSFDTDVKYTPSIGKSSSVSYDYYLSRYDRIIVDKNGRVGFTLGVANEYPAPPPESENTMTIGIMYVPAFPALPKSVADAANVPSYAVRLTRKNNKNYTMREIGEIDQRVNNLEYYTLLNSLEKKATDYTISDSAGLDRFKNGIFVDNFRNLLLGDIQDQEFSSGIDPSRSEIHPRFRVFPVDLKINTKSDVTDWGEAVTLPLTSEELINQPYATNQRSCTTSFYKWKGTVQLNPEFDANVDNTRAPDVNFEVDLATPFTEYTAALHELIPPVVPTGSVSSSETEISFGEVDNRRRDRVEVTTTTNIDSFLDRQITIDSKNTSQQYGDFVRDVRFSPYLQSRPVDVYVTGLRPNTHVYMYFDGKSIADYSAPAELQDVSSTGLSGPKVTPTADYSSANVIRTDSNGVLVAQFLIPADTFYVGDRLLEIADVSSYSDINAASTTYAKKVYGGFNNSVEKSAIGVSTRVPEIDFSENAFDVVTVEQNTLVTSQSYDPIAQTFFVEPEYSSDTAIFVNKMDIFFAKKSSSAGVTVQIRNVVNGYPGGQVVPFSSVHLDASDVVASDTSAASPTTVQFKGPVSLEVGKEYCFVILPDGSHPDYRVWISRVGEVDVDSNETINLDTNTGTLFTSTNNRAWTAYQDENIKYKLYKSRFTKASGYCTLTNGDDEYLEIENVNGAFQNGEEVFVNASDLTGTINVTAGNTTITGSGTTFTGSFVAEEYLIYRPTANTYQALQIEEVTSDTEIVLKDVPFVSNTAANFFRSVVGKVSYYHSYSDPVVIALKDSTAKTGLVWEANTSIQGTRSNANAEIIEVRNTPVSFMMPKVFRTNFTKTNTDMTGSQFWGSTTGGLYSKDAFFQDFNRFRNEPTYVKSRTNEILDDAGAKSFSLKVNLNNTSLTTLDTSPFVDHAISAVDMYEYLVNDTLDGEHTNLGEAKSKYVSKDLTLVDGFEAEDIRVLLTAYRPTGTNIDVYIKFKSDYDVRNLDEVSWSKLINTSATSAYSASSNINDVREFEYKMNTVEQTEAYGAWVNSSETIQYENDGVVFYDYKNYKVKIVFRSASHNLVPRVKDLRVICVS